MRDCYLVVSESADTLSVSYNAFARFRRKGLVTYAECLKLQHAMNAQPFTIMREVVEAIADQGTVTPEVRIKARAGFRDACDNFLRLLRFVEVCTARRSDESGVRLLSPMYLC